MSLSRREVMLAVGASALVSRAEGSSPTFVLIHGAWHGGWAWDAVVKGLTAKGHKAVAPTLTGVAERAKELSASVNLTTHVDDIVKVCEPLERVTLVGHSYGGLVISGCVDRLAPKIERLVYLDAFLPEPGQCGFDLMKKEYGQHWKERAKGGPGVPPMLSAKSMGVLDEKQAKAVDARLTPHPLATFEEKVQFDLEKWKALKKTYLRAKKYSGFGPTAARAKTLGLEVEEIDSGHDVMLAAPEALVAALDRTVAK
ncbi:MAG: alpha/beta hydrolase family protein [Archangium sp.]